MCLSAAPTNRTPVSMDSSALTSPKRWQPHTRRASGYPSAVSARQPAPAAAAETPLERPWRWRPGPQPVAPNINTTHAAQPPASEFSIVDDDSKRRPECHQLRKLGRSVVGERAGNSPRTANRFATRPALWACNAPQGAPRGTTGATSVFPQPTLPLGPRSFARCGR